MSKASTPNTTSRGCFAATGDLFGPRADIAVPAIAPKPATALPIVFAEDVTHAVNFARQSIGAVHAPSLPGRLRRLPRLVPTEAYARSLPFLRRWRPISPARQRQG
jgi:hypothetical protein